MTHHRLRLLAVAVPLLVATGLAGCGHANDPVLVRPAQTRIIPGSEGLRSVILTPVAPTPAFKIGEKVNDPLQMYLSDIFTIPVNLAGTCGMSVPAGFSSEGLPIGLQLVGRPFGEETIIRAAYTFEQATDWHKRKADL